MAPTRKPSKSREKGEGRERSKYAQAGEDGRRAAQRKLLLATLKSVDWNLSRAAEELGISGAPGIIRAMKDVALDEYEAARADGRIRAGVRSP